jgi:hypothetical protein
MYAVEVVSSWARLNIQRWILRLHCCFLRLFSSFGLFSVDVSRLAPTHSPKLTLNKTAQTLSPRTFQLRVKIIARGFPELAAVGKCKQSAKIDPSPKAFFMSLNKIFNLWG